MRKVTIRRNRWQNQTRRRKLRHHCESTFLCCWWKWVVKSWDPPIFTSTLTRTSRTCVCATSRAVNSHPRRPPLIVPPRPWFSRSQRKTVLRRANPRHSLTSGSIKPMILFSTRMISRGLGALWIFDSYDTEVVVGCVDFPNALWPKPLLCDVAKWELNMLTVPWCPCHLQLGTLPLRMLIACSTLQSVPLSALTVTVWWGLEGLSFKPGLLVRWPMPIVFRPLITGLLI